MAGGITQAGDPGKIQVVRGDEVIIQDLGEATTIGAARIQSGDQIVVVQKGWIARNSGVVVGSWFRVSVDVEVGVRTRTSSGG